MKFTMQRKRTIVSMSGLSVEFEKGVPTHVPPQMYEEVLSAGGVPEDELPEEKMKDEVPVPQDPESRKKAMFALFEKLVLKGKREDFTAAGSPHPKVVEDALGWSVSKKELTDAWTAFQTADKD